MEGEDEAAGGEDVMEQERNSKEAKKDGNWRPGKDEPEFPKFCQGTVHYLHFLLPKNTAGGDFQEGITPSFQLELGNSVCRKNNPNQGFFFPPLSNRAKLKQGWESKLKESQDSQSSRLSTDSNKHKLQPAIPTSG